MPYDFIKAERALSFLADIADQHDKHKAEADAAGQTYIAEQFLVPLRIVKLAQQWRNAALNK